MKDIELSSKKYIIKSILRKTKSSILKDFKVGDEIIFTIELYSPGRGGSARNLYATYYYVRNITQGTYKQDTLSSTEAFFTIFDLEEVL